ncbi:MAG: S9 family peptidase [Cyclobacteriaceae bacterium]|nr:S9 family peptidase [Cyclobacteriaceae bacterium]
MKINDKLLLQGALMAVLLFPNCTSMNSDKNPMAPAADKEPKELLAHGNTRIDNYYWMRLTDEQKNAEVKDDQTKKVLDWLTAENDHLKSVLGHTEAFQEQLFNEMKGRIKEDDESVPYFENGYWYYSKFAQGQEYPVYYRKKGSLDAAEEVLIDENELAKGREFFSLGDWSVSPDNKLLAFSEDTLSRRIYTIKFKNLETGELLPDIIKNTEGNAAWANDNRTVFYTSKNDVTLLSEKILRHSLDTNSDKDVVVYQEKDPAFYIGVYRSKSGKYIILTQRSTLARDYQILESDAPQGEFRQFTARETDMLYSLEHFQDKFYIVTNWEAKNFRLMETSISRTSKENWKEVIAHRPEVLMEGIEVFNDFLVVSERKAGLANLRIIHQTTKDEHYLEFDENCYTVYPSVNPELATDWLRFCYSSLTTPNSTFDYNMLTHEKVLKKQQEVVGGHDPDDYFTERIYATARDGVQVPISIVYKKDFVKDGSKPLLLYGYGSYGATIDPAFNSSLLSLLDRGFAYAIAHVRGGEMLGRQWYEDGKLLKKKNTFYDFIDCAKYLINENYTSQEHIYAQGGSAGGLLMGAVLNYEPVLFNGVIAAVPFVDVVSTMSDPSIPLTTNEYDEWGNPENKEYYDYILSYSPYDNVEKKAYTNILVTTGLFDSQVQYWEPAKWVAKLREYKTDDNMLILHTNMEAGHGGASGRFKRLKDTALNYTFILNLEGQVQ